MTHWHVELSYGGDRPIAEPGADDFPNYTTPASALAGVIDQQAAADFEGEHGSPYVWECDGTECRGRTP